MKDRFLILAILTFIYSVQVQANTVLYNSNIIVINDVLADPNDLWIAPSDLTRVNGFELKPEGACLNDICVPVKQEEDSDIFLKRGQKRWFNLTELARKLEQAYVFDHESSVWSFGPIPVTRQAFTNQHQAPDFSIANRQGEPVSLSQFKDMKVPLLTWASW